MILQTDAMQLARDFHDQVVFAAGKLTDHARHEIGMADIVTTNPLNNSPVDPYCLALRDVALLVKFYDHVAGVLGQSDKTSCQDRASIERAKLDMRFAVLESFGIDPEKSPKKPKALRLH